MYGVRARGGGDPLDHATGVGRVDAHDGYYADARAKGHAVELLITEATGGVHHSALAMLKRYQTALRAAPGSDRTTYGRSRTAARGYTGHWLRLLSTSIAVSLSDSVSAWARVVSGSVACAGGGPVRP